MKVKQIAIGMDKIVIRLSNTFISIEKATLTLLSIFDYDLESLQFFQTPNQKCYFSKNHGTDFKISQNQIIIEFHGTFCALYGWKRFKILKSKIQESFKTFARVSEIHVAQDYINLPVTNFFKHPHLVFRFKSRKNEIENPQTGEIETIYLRSINFRWNLTIYDKTAELKKNISKSSPLKIEHYRERGYLNNKITRIELKLHADYCKKFIETFESNKSELKICEAILNYWFKKHKIYSLKKSSIFDAKHPERHQVWSIWKRLFSSKQTIKESKLPEDALFKNFHRTDLDVIAEKLTNNSFKYNENPRELLFALMDNKVQLIKKADEALERRRKTEEYLQSLIKPAA